MAGCSKVPPQFLDRDAVDYANALSDARKREILLNIVRLRYGDVPVFLSASQVISGRILTNQVEIAGAASPRGALTSFLTGGDTVTYSDRPTLSFTPVAGEEYSDTYLRPLSPAQVLQLVQGTRWLEAVMRLGVQSIQNLRNSNDLNGPASHPAPDFLHLLDTLRSLQDDGAIGLRFHREKELTRMYLVFLDVPAARPAQDEARKLLQLPAQAREAEIVYGHGRVTNGSINVATRSFLAMLQQAAGQVEVPGADLSDGRAFTVEPADPAAPPIIRIHSGTQKPADAHVMDEYHGRWFWIASTDLRSKTAFTVLELARIAAESAVNLPQRQRVPVITIPTD